MAQIYRLEDFTEDGEYSSEFINGFLNKIYFEIEGITQFIQILITNEDGEEIVKFVPSDNSETVTPRKKVVDLVTEGIYEKYLIYGELYIKIIGLTPESKISQIKIYIE
jgi:hypothetical protein